MIKSESLFKVLRAIHYLCMIGQVTFSRGDVYRLSNLSRNTVYSVIDELNSMGTITYSHTGKNRSKVYTFVPEFDAKNVVDMFHKDCPEYVNFNAEYHKWYYDELSRVTGILNDEA